MDPSMAPVRLLRAGSDFERRWSLATGLGPIKDYRDGFRPPMFAAGGLTTASSRPLGAVLVVFVL